VQQLAGLPLSGRPVSVQRHAPFLARPVQHVAGVPISVPPSIEMGRQHVPPLATPEQQVPGPPSSPDPLATHAQVPAVAYRVQQLSELPLSLAPVAMHAHTPASAEPVQQLSGLPLSRPFMMHAHIPPFVTPEQQLLTLPLSDARTGAHAQVPPSSYPEQHCAAEPRSSMPFAMQPPPVSPDEESLPPFASCVAVWPPSAGVRLPASPERASCPPSDVSMMSPIPPRTWHAESRTSEKKAAHPPTARRQNVAALIEAA
jgi:hypothetical protein